MRHKAVVQNQNEASPAITGCTLNNPPANTTAIGIESSSPNVTSNTITGFITGIDVTTSGSPIVQSNAISGNTDGIKIGASSNGVYQENQVSNNIRGIHVTYGQNNPVVVGNSYSNNSIGNLMVTGSINTVVDWGTGFESIIQIQNLNIQSDGSLIISPGKTLKFFPDTNLEIYGTLLANGATFTSLDGTTPWGGILFYGAGSNNSRLENSVIEQAAGWYYNAWPYGGRHKAVVQNQNEASPAITGCTLNNPPANTTAIGIESSSPNVTSNTITGFITGIDVTTPDSPIVQSNTISDNDCGIKISGPGNGTYTGNIIQGNSTYGVNNIGSSFVNFINNNWGHPSGPLDNSDDRAAGGLYNPYGLGDKVSNLVNYFPWVGSISALTAIPTGLDGKPGNGFVTLTWNANTEPFLNGYKIYYGTTPGTYGTPLIVGKVTSYRITNLQNGIPYFITISSMNDVGAESEKAPEISVTPIYDVTAPTSVITYPADGALIMGAQTIRGTADDGTGSGVFKVEISTDGGTTWAVATGTDNLTYRWTPPGNGAYNIRTRATDNADNVETPGPGINVTVATRVASLVKVQGRRLLVDGNPFLIKGVGYAPTPIGDDPEVLGNYGDYFTSDHSNLYDRDLPWIRGMKSNTLRLWNWNPAADHLDFLDKAYNDGTDPIYVIPTFWIAAGLDLSQNAVRESLKSQFRGMVAAHKEHPAILMWAIGNELNAPWMYADHLPDLFSLIDELAAAAHEEEGPNYHPVVVPLADIDLIQTIATYENSVPHLDVWGANVYRGNSFGTLFSDFAQAGAKPLAVLEFGIDSYDQVNGDEYENLGAPYQSLYAASLWNEIRANRDICIGGTIMAYCDEWWKGKYGEASGGCPENDPSVHSACGYPTASHPDQYANEEWWGIVRIRTVTGNQGLQGTVIEPRAVYQALKTEWAKADFGYNLYLPLIKR
jgi:parallel beta-helix repeat protein